MKKEIATATLCLLAFAGCTGGSCDKSTDKKASSEVRTQSQGFDAAALKLNIERGLKGNPNIASINVNVLDHQNVDGLANFYAATVELSGTLRNGQQVKQRVTYFVSGGYMFPDAIDMSTGQSIKELFGPKFETKYYTKHNLISGSENSKHKVAIFSDPLCPYCRRFVPGAIEYMAKYPEEFAIYYYHLPLKQIHPASVELTEAAIAAETKKDKKEAILDMYKVNIGARESNNTKILDAYNAVTGTKLTMAATQSPEVLGQIQADEKVAQEMMVNGTPTLYFDGIKDNIQNPKFKAVKVPQK